jgi:hypothetical protein
MTITTADIAPGDVLLFHGRGFISWAIRKLDGTRVNHAAIALDGDRLGEAAGSGLRRSSIVQAVANNDSTVVRRLPDQDLAPVLAKANFYLDGHVPYAYQQIVLLALLTTTRKIPMPQFAKRLVRSVLDHAAAALNAMVDSGAKTMICSEYVYRCYDEASDQTPDPFAIDILGRAGGLSFEAGGLPAEGEEGSLLSWALTQPAEKIESAGSMAFAAGPPPPPVAPEELEQQLAPLIQEYAMQVDPEDPEVQAMAPVAFAQPTVPEPEPTDEEILASMTAFSTALERHQEDQGRVEFGVGEDVARGALKGLLHVSADSNFVTPGDLLNTPSLKDIGEL